MMTAPVPATERTQDASAPTVGPRRGMRASDSRATPRRLRPSQVPLGPREIPPRLGLASGNDPLEREAEAVAERVRTGETRVSIAGVTARRLDGEAVGGVPPSVEEVLRSPGTPLGDRARALMEPRFGTDFGHVRVHADAEAARAAQAIRARAYASGAR
jgi:Domain of unknown function (DUF4157)